MEEELISKKDLLIETDISYGQLYRWKRKNIIPEEWFIKKASFTGQETYFPREKILERIQKIKDLKDNLSLDELAEQFSLKPTALRLHRDKLLEKNIVTDTVLDIYESLFEKIEMYDFSAMLKVFIFNIILETGKISVEEASRIITNYNILHEANNEKLFKILYLRKYGIGTCLFGVLPCEFYPEQEAKIVLNIDIPDMIEELKIKINE